MYETLLLISQAVKSGLPLSAAIRLTVGGQSERGTAALLRFAELLDKGVEPKVAAGKSGLPQPVLELLDAALTSDDFASTFDELAKLEISRSVTIQRVVQALAYPLALLVFTAFLVGAIFVVIVPQFEEMFNDFGITGTSLIAWFIQCSHLLRTPAVWLGFAVFAVVMGVAIKILFPRFWFCIPVFGHIGRCLYTARMLRQMAGMVLRNVPLPEALERCGKTMRNVAYRRDCLAAAAAARKGMSFAEITLRYYWLFPAWLAPTIAVGNRRESLSKSLRRAAETVEQQKEVSIVFLQTLCLPLFVIFISFLMVMLVMALFKPMISSVISLS